MSFDLNAKNFRMFHPTKPKKAPSNPDSGDKMQVFAHLGTPKGGGSLFFYYFCIT